MLIVKTDLPPEVAKKLRASLVEQGISDKSMIFIPDDVAIDNIWLDQEQPVDVENRFRCVQLAIDYYKSKNGSIPNDDLINISERIYQFIKG